MVGGNGDVKQVKQGGVYINGITGLGSEDIKVHEIILYLETGLGLGKCQGWHSMKPVSAFGPGLIGVGLQGTGEGVGGC